MRLKPYYLAWAAGFFEGEGSIMISKPQKRNWGSLIVSVVNTDLEAVAWFNKIWPGHLKRCKSNGENKRMAWRWIIASNDALDFLKCIRRHVLRKKVLEKIDHAIYFQEQKMPSGSFRNDPVKKEQYRKDQWDAYWWMAELNKRGVA